jgi:hypothetical protein
MTDEPSGGDRPPFWFPVFWTDERMRPQSAPFRVLPGDDEDGD